MARRSTSVLVALLVLLATGAATLVAAPATASGGGWRASITFTKNRASQFESQVTWRVAHRAPDGSWQTVQQRSWRAGSGLPQPGGQDECHRNVGWLPDGGYRFRQYDHYRGSVIHGRVFRLSDKACGNGTVRQALFIHSEQTVGNRQCRGGAGDSPCRWDYPRINDYRSNGCIKMSPGDLAALTRLYHRQRHAHPGTAMRVTVAG